MTIRYWLIACSLAVASSHAAALECWRAKTPPEVAICANPRLKAYDEYLDRAYASVRNTVPSNVVEGIRRDQITWIRERDRKCSGDVTCLMGEVQARTAALTGLVQRYVEEMRYGAPGPPVELPRSSSTLPASQLDPREIYRKAAQSVVVVIAFNSANRAIGQGSGVVIAANTIATNCHVIESAESATILFRNTPYEANRAVGNKTSDYCILRTTGLPAVPAETAGLSTVAPGQRVYSVGSPRGLELTIAEGLVSGLRKKDGIPLPLIQTSAPISPGSSGGGLFDEYGRVIGITSFLLRDSQSLNFALPIELIRSIAK